MKLFPAILLSLLLPLRCFATIIVAELSRERIIIAADSRGVVTANGSPTEQRDDVSCKITPLDSNAVFFNTGLDSVPHPSGSGFVSVSEIAKRTFDKLKPISDGYWLGRVVAEWGDTVRDFAARVPISTYKPLLTDAVFINTDGQTIRGYQTILAVVDIPGAGGQQIAVSNTFLSHRKSSIALFGMQDAYEFVNEFIANKTPRANSANRRFAEAFPDTKDRDYEPNRIRSAVDLPPFSLPVRSRIPQD
jgi:hypothetical protein